MAHDQVFWAERAKRSREGRSVIAGGIEIREAREPLIEFEAASPRLRSEANRKRSDGQRFAPHIPGQNCPGSVCGVAQPDSTGKAHLNQGVQQDLSDSRQDVDVLVAIDIIRQAPEMLGESIDLAPDFAGEFWER
jgi:hypothetical protein